MKSFLCILFFSNSIAAIAFPVGINLCAHFDAMSKSVKLSWQNNDPDIDAYVLERSTDRIHWINLFEKKNIGLGIEKCVDPSPVMTNINYYRLRIQKMGSTIYSDSILVMIGESINSWKMFPVPVTDVINLQYTGSEALPGTVTVFIRSSYGRVFNQTRSASLNRIIQIPVNNLGRGVYDAILSIGNQVIWTQRFIK